MTIQATVQQCILFAAPLWLILGCVNCAGLAGYGTQICMTYALKYSKAAPAIAMSYLSVVWGLLGGYFFFHEVCTLHPAALHCALTLRIELA